LTPAQAHAEAVAAAGSRRSPSTTAIFDEDETYFTHSLFRQLAVSHLASQATADRGISAEGAEAIRAMDVFKQSFRDADLALNELEQAGASIRLDSVVRKRKKKMSKHKYKKRIKVRRPLLVARRWPSRGTDTMFPLLSPGPKGDAEEARQVRRPAARPSRARYQ
jgi:hypothetical protein